MNIDLQQYARILVCPICHSKLAIDGASFVCRSTDCRRRFLVRDDIPVMLADEAVQVTPEEWSVIMSKVADA